MAGPSQDERDAGVPQDIFLKDPIYHQIASRLLSTKPGVSLKEHIDVMQDIGRTISEGLTFWVHDVEAFRTAITTARDQSNQPAFHWDNRKIWIYKLAALATDGEGYREIGQPSLHCAIGSGLCNVHIDEFGFVFRDKDGNEYVSPEAIRHIADELIYRAKIRPVIEIMLRNGLPPFLAEPVMKLLDRTYVKVPSLSDNYGMRLDGKWKPRVGVGYKLPVTKRVNLRFEYTCGNPNCSDHSETVTLSVDVP